MDLIKRKSLHLLWLLIFPVLGLTYTFLNQSTSSMIDLHIVMDDFFPLIPIFIIPYILWYAFIFCYLIYFCFKDTKVYKHALITIVVGELICFFCYVFFQSTVERPPIEGDGMLHTLIQFIYNNDEPFNCFPSIHVLTTYTIMLASIRIKNMHVINATFIQLMGTLIILSTLFVKQHVVIDVVASILIVSMIYSALVAFSAKRHNINLTEEKTVLKASISKKRAFR